jgi:type IV pilus assembly protein PilX
MRSDISVARERGAVLVVGLIFLILLMLIGVTALNVATLEEQQSGNLRDRLRALEGAEVALRACEEILARAVAPDFTPDGAGGYYISMPGDPEIHRKSGFSWTDNRHTQVIPDPQEFGRDLRCVVERLDGAPVSAPEESIRAELPSEMQGYVYRVTARGVGVNSNTVSVVQSYFNRG